MAFRPFKAGILKEHREAAMIPRTILPFKLGGSGGGNGFSRRVQPFLKAFNAVAFGYA